MMKKGTAILLVLILALGMLSIPAFARDAADKLSEEVKLAVERSQPEETLSVSVWFIYPPSPEPDFTENDYGTDLASLQEYTRDYRAFKRAYHTEQNEKAMQQLRSKVAFEVRCIGSYSPSNSIDIMVKDIETLAAQDVVADIYLEDMTMIRDRSAFLYEEKFIEMLNPSQKRLYEYSELFYHHDAEGNPDWVLVKGRSGYVGEIVAQMEIGGRVITYGYASNFKFGYGVFDVEQDCFVDLYDIRDDVDRYENLRDILWRMKIGRPVGDADNDGELTVLDATAIQKKLANIQNAINSNYDIYYRVYGLETDGKEYHFSDYDGDGVLSIIDATHIQKHLASLE